MYIAYTVSSKRSLQSMDWLSSNLIITIQTTDAAHCQFYIIDTTPLSAR